MGKKKPVTIKDIDLVHVDAVIFDLDGTLYNSQSLIRRVAMSQIPHLVPLAWERVIRRRMRGISFDSAEEFQTLFYQQVAARCIRSAAAVRRWYETNLLPAMCRVLKRYYHVEPWAVQLIQDLRAAGKIVVIYSDYAAVADKLKALGTSIDIFDLAYDAPSLGGLKPAKISMTRVVEGIDALSMQRSGKHIPTSRCLMIGDRMTTDGESAKAVGAQYLILQDEDE